MPTLTINVPGDLLRRIRKNLARCHRTVEDYWISSLYDLAGDEHADEAQPLDARMIAKAEEALRSPSIKADDAYWDGLIKRVRRLRKRPPRSRHLRDP